MNLMKLADAYKAAEKLSNQSGLTRSNSIRVYKLKEALRQAYDYLGKEEEKIIMAHQNFDPATNRVTGTDAVQARAEALQVKKELDELHNAEWEVQDLPEKFTISKDEKTDNLVPNDFGVLMEFIEFEE